jgi:hypothetical protein
MVLNMYQLHFLLILLLMLQNAGLGAAVQDVDFIATKTMVNTNTGCIP